MTPVARLQYNVFDPVLSQLQVISHHFNIVQYKHIYHNQSTIVIDNLRYTSVLVLHLPLVYMKKTVQIKQTPLLKQKSDNS